MTPTRPKSTPTLRRGHARRVAAFAPSYCYHLLTHPYRPGRSETSDTGHLARFLLRHRAALYDGCVSLILRAWSESAGVALRPDAGRVAVLITRVGFAFDDEFERRHAAGEDVTFGAVMASAALRQSLRAWRDRMESEASYGAIKAFLDQRVAQLHGHYLERDSVLTVEPGDVAAIVDRAELDSGGFLMLLVHVTALLHGQSAPPSDLTREVECLGAVGKLADDMIDFRADLAAGRPNILSALSLEHPAENQRVEAAVADGTRLTARWWRTQCPRTFAAYSTLCDEYLESISSRHLQIVWAMIWLPARFAHALAQESRGRL